MTMEHSLHYITRSFSLSKVKEDCEVMIRDGSIMIKMLVHCLLLACHVYWFFNFSRQGREGTVLLGEENLLQT